MIEIDRYNLKNGKYEVKGSTTKTIATIDTNRNSIQASIEKDTLALANYDTPNFNMPIDISWLPQAAKSYDISSNIKDYVLTDVPLVTVPLPNRNLQAFPMEEVTFFDPIYGSLVYQTFIGKGAYVEHANKDPLKSKGISLAATLKVVPKYNIAKICVLTGWCRQKDGQLAEDIASGKRPYFSMGATVAQFLCSKCKQFTPCTHMKAGPDGEGKGNITSGQLIYQDCLGVCFFDNSSVSNPADVTAESESLLFM